MTTKSKRVRNHEQEEHEYRKPRTRPRTPKRPMLNRPVYRFVNGSWEATETKLDSEEKE